MTRFRGITRLGLSLLIAAVGLSACTSNDGQIDKLAADLTARESELAAAQAGIYELEQRVNPGLSTLKSSDPTHLGIAAVVTVGEPWHSVSAMGLLGDSLLVAKGDGSLSKISATGVRERTVVLPNVGAIRRLEITPTAIWALASPRGEILASSVLRFTHDLQLQARQDFDAGSVRLTDIQANELGVWVSEYFSGTVLKLALSDGRMVGRYAAGPEPLAIALDGQAVWIANNGEQGTVTKLRVADGMEQARYAVGSRPFHIQVADGFLWAANYGDTTLAKLDLATGRIAERYALPSIRNFIVVGGAVWVPQEGLGDRTAGVIRIGIRDNSVSKPISLGMKVAEEWIGASEDSLYVYRSFFDLSLQDRPEGWIGQAYGPNNAQSILRLRIGSAAGQ